MGSHNIAHPHGGRFHIPSHLIETQAGGRRLIEWVWAIWGEVGAMPAPSAGRVKLAGWLMGDHPARVAAVELAGISITDLLAARVDIDTAQGVLLEEVTGGEISLSDWTRPHSDAGDIPPKAPASLGDDMAAIAPPAVSSPHPIIHGTLGATAMGKLFRCVRGGGNNLFILTGQGISLALDRGSAADIVESLADALGLELMERRA